jgi:predicted nucleic acid-binding protein
VNWVDTPLLAYGTITGHPARFAVEQELRRGTWGSSVLVLLELYQVLTRDYAVAPADAAVTVGRLSRAPIHWAALDLGQATIAVAERWRHRLQATDAVLLLLAKEDGGTLVTEDRRLLYAAEEQGIVTRRLITPDLSMAVGRWEEQHLPPKGLARILNTIERWVRRENSDLADRFVEATAHLTSLPG